MLECTIYFIRCPMLRAIKIGQAGNPHKRMAEMQVGCPIDLVMYGIFQAPAGTERKLHAQFRGQRIRGEWFKESAELFTFIDELIANGMPEKPKRDYEQEDEFNRLVRAIHAPVDLPDV
jgi:hypothetical protein